MTNLKTNDLAICAEVSHFTIRETELFCCQGAIS